MIKAQNLTKIYPDGNVALSGINLEMAPGEFIFLVGQSGAGKTTLLKMLLGMETPSAGLLEVNDLDLAKGNVQAVREIRRITGTVFQDFKLIESRTALENVILSLQVLGRGGQGKEEAFRVLTEVGLGEKTKQPVEALSWGERQRVAFARAMVRQPLLFVADEPTGNLDEKTAGIIADLLERIQEKGATVIVATHDLRLVEGMRKRVITLEKGHLINDTQVKAKELTF